MSYDIKNSGNNIIHESGMSREDKSDKIDYTLCYLPLLDRWASWMTKGGKIHGKENWMKANSPEEEREAITSLWRHFRAFIDDKQDEDHAAAMFFNICLIEHIRSKHEEGE